MKKKVNNLNETIKNKGVILFDGYCNLCSWSVRFIIKRDQRDYFRFASLQSTIAKQILKDFDLPPEYDQSVILIQHHKIYFKSDAALQISKSLKGFWKYLYYFVYLPKKLRDLLYMIIAKYRYKLFGKKESCFVPDESLDYKFLSNAYDLLKP